MRWLTTHRRVWSGIFPPLFAVVVLSGGTVLARGGGRGILGGPVYVRPHASKSGTYIPGHYRSAPDGSFSNNWSTKGNINPFTGQEGTRVTPPQPRYSSPSTRYLAPKLPPSPDAALGSGASTYVSPTIRKDGTPVVGHFRSAPDGRFENNWSTKGNINPYTGAEGTRLTPPLPSVTGSEAFPLRLSAPSPPYVGPPSVPLPLPMVRPLRVPHIRATTPTSRLPAPKPSTSYGFDDAAMRRVKALSLARLGVKVDWRHHSWVELSDQEMRVRKAADLGRLGINVDWRTHSWADMSDQEMRIRKAGDLRRLGEIVDWRQLSWADMSDREMRIRKALDLRRLGISVDWHQHSWIDMMEMEKRARGR